MFSKNAAAERIVERIEDLLVDLDKKIDKLIGAKKNDKEDYWDYVCCNECNCLMYRTYGIQGKSVVKTRLEYDPSREGIYGASCLVEKEYVSKTYYCGRCAPEQEKQDNADSTQT